MAVMELHDGFIVGIFNYCDRWCEACAFTARCRVFADRAEMDARHDPNFKAVASAPLLPQDQPPTLPDWMLEILEEAERHPLTEKELEDLEPKPRPEHARMESCAMDYSRRTFEWLKPRQDPEKVQSDPHNPLDVIGWFSFFIAAKVHRAGFSKALWDQESDEEYPTDYDGSAKAALEAIDRSRAAWLAMAETGAATREEVMPFIMDLVWLRETLEREFPKARDFVRPGLDEPEAVAKLESTPDLSN